MSYEGLVEDMIDAVSVILGEQAIGVAKNVRGLQVDDDGTVLDITEEPVTVVDDLVAAYRDSLGDAAVGKLRQVAEDHEDLDLPASLT